MIQAITSFFVESRMPKEVNSSLIILIPETPNPSSTNNYRPISLCNVVYKIISKLLVAKIQPLLHKLISPCQFAFIPRRWTAKNQLIIQEMLHSFEVRKFKTGFIAIKLELQKAYDKVNWGFIQAVLFKFSFDEGFISWIIACISTVSFKVLVNGGKLEQFKPTQGIRQGDPLSSCIFILGQEILSRILDHEFCSKNISGVKASIGGPAITHVMYVDDIILFSKATRNDASNIVSCVEKYCNWLG